MFFRGPRFHEFSIHPPALPCQHHGLRNEWHSRSIHVRCDDNWRTESAQLNASYFFNSFHFWHGHAWQNVPRFGALVRTGFEHASQARICEIYLYFYREFFYVHLIFQSSKEFYIVADSQRCEKTRHPCSRFFSKVHLAAQHFSFSVFHPFLLIFRSLTSSPFFQTRNYQFFFMLASAQSLSFSALRQVCFLKKMFLHFYLQWEWYKLCSSISAFLWAKINKIPFF